MGQKVGYGRVSTASGEQLSALPVQLAWLRDQGCDPVLHDVESGLNVDRPAYTQLLAIIEQRAVATLCATRADRLGRDALELVRLVQLCDQAGVLVSTRDDGVLSAKTPEELMLLFVRAALAQGESMKVSQRVRGGLEQGRKSGKPMRKPCWGYRLSADRSCFEPDPEAFPAARRFIAYLQENEWRTVTSLRTYPGEVPFRSCRGVRAWLLNPTLRGGVGYHQQKNHRYKEILWEQHEALLSHAEFAEYERRAEANRRLWGANTTVKPRLLTGLCVCSECGCRLKYIGGRTIPSLKCSGTQCSQLYKGTREQLIVEYAIQALITQASERLVMAVEHDEPPEAMELRSRIDQLEQMNDPDLAPIIQQKQQQLAAMLKRPPRDDALLQKVADPRWYALATYEELRIVLQQLVEAIAITRQEPTAIRLRL